MILDDFKQEAELQAKLTATGLSEAAGRDKQKLLDQSCNALLEAGLAGGRKALGIFVPGRIEFLGKHTDYAGGCSIIATTEKGFGMIAVPRSDHHLKIISATTKEKIEFDLNSGLQPVMGHWSNYPMTVGRRVARNFPGLLLGADVAFTSDLPVAAGMSSSSALMVGIFQVLATINQLDQREEYLREINDTESLAGYLGTIENGQSYGSLTGDKGVGTFGGSEDHTAMLCAQTGRLSQYRYCPVRFEQTIDMPAEYVFVIASSGVMAEKTGAALEKYNRASRLASAVVQAWNQTTGRKDQYLATALSSSPAALNQMRDILKNARVDGFNPEELTKRFEHFYVESEKIIPTAAAALTDRDMATLSQEVDRSQELADTLLGNQVAETVFLARLARELGATAATAFGAGFGGSVWALVTGDTAEEFRDEWARQYQHVYPQRTQKASFFISQAGPATFVIQ